MTFLVGTNSSISPSLYLFVLSPLPHFSLSLPPVIGCVTVPPSPTLSGPWLPGPIHLYLSISVHTCCYIIKMNVSLNLKLVLLVFFMP